MSTDLVRTLLASAQANLAAALELLEPEAAPPPASASCPHPPDHQLEAYVAGKPKQFFCKACEMLVNPEAVEAPPLGGA